MAEPGFVYSGAELEALSQGRNYYRWIRAMFGGALRGRVVEVGAGLGTFSAYLTAEAAIEELILVEPDAAMHGALDDRFSDQEAIRAVHGTFDDVALDNEVDAIVLVNVLEHIEDDAGLVAAARRALRPGGSLLLFVPAGPALYGSLDREFEHYRRYQRSPLIELVTSSGLVPDEAYYVNAPGMLAWFVAGRILKQRTIRQGQMKLYDRLVIPLVRAVESVIRPPLGQSLLVVAKRPADNEGTS